MERIDEPITNIDQKIIDLKNSKAKMEQILNYLTRTGKNWFSINDQPCITAEEIEFAHLKICEELETAELQRIKHSMLNCNHLFITVCWPKIGDCFDEQIACVKCGFDTRFRYSGTPIGQITDEVYSLNMDGIISDICCNNLALAQRIYLQVKGKNQSLNTKDIMPIFAQELNKAKQKIKS